LTPTLTPKQWGLLADQVGCVAAPCETSLKGGFADGLKTVYLKIVGSMTVQVMIVPIVGQTPVPIGTPCTDDCNVLFTDHADQVYLRITTVTPAPTAVGGSPTPTPAAQLSGWVSSDYTQ